MYPHRLALSVSPAPRTHSDHLKLVLIGCQSLVRALYIGLHGGKWTILGGIKVYVQGVVSRFVVYGWVKDFCYSV